MIAAALLAAAAPAVAETVFEVPARYRLIEGVATDGRTIWVISVVDRVVLAWRGGRLRAMPMPKGTARPLGIAYDARRRWLWIATDCPDLAAIDVCQESGALVAIDASGRLRAKVSPGAGAHFGDASVDGDVVTVSDSSNGAVYRCRGACRSLDPVIPPSAGGSAQGSVAIAGGLLVADYGQGLTYVATDGSRSALPRPDGRPLRGIDGMARLGDRVFGVQNGRSPAIVLSFALSPDRRGVVEVRQLGEPLPEPTQLAVAPAGLLVVADAQWAAYDRAAAARPAQHATPILRLRFPAS